MTADTTCGYSAALAERRAAYEADVINALLDETEAEREERLELVRMAQAMILRSLQTDQLSQLDPLDDEPFEN
ncbi:MAG: hypothetical protein ACXWQR_00485 [Ktedonobacterales bacterium]